MQQSDDLYRGFLEEMQALENFRTTYSGLRTTASLQREDPDVRRLIEAMAFFTARTKGVARRGILATRRRLFRQYFPFLLHKIPAAAILEATITGRFAEPQTLPKGSEILLRAGQDPRPASFRTTEDLRLLPLHLRGAETVMRPRGAGPRLILHLETPYPRTDGIGTLRVHVSHMGSYHASIHLLANLETHLERAFCCFEDRVTEDATGPPVPVRFGDRGDTTQTPQPGDPHPLERIRQFLHFPEEELFCAFDIPDPPRHWRRFSICLDLDRRWPKNLRLHADAFKLFCVPVRNMRSEMADPILCDGTKERFAIRHPDRGRGFALQSVSGVYEVTEAGLQALRPGVLGGGSGSYEIETDMGGPGGSQRGWVLLDMPEAFEEPRKIAVEGLWTQPWFSEKVGERIDVTIRDRVLNGVQWEILGALRAEADTGVADDADGLLQILALRTRDALGIDDLRALFGALADLGQSHFRNVPELLEDLSVRVVQQPSAAGYGLKQLYQLQLAPHEPTFAPVVRQAMQRIAQLLDGWVSASSIELEVTTKGSDKVDRYRA